ncbi:cysteine desulfurase [candidate division KSB1 bacterium]|nr:cysteine desulfurase [candidate division KSB1 bacterium]RQW05608.1 MAG: cysteine desulfurase [candidate division KSB1 bacterium]
MKQIYLDHHATTPLDKEVLDAMIPTFMQDFGNPSSNTHEYGHRARYLVDNARKQVAQLIGAKNPDDIIFTSGATESNNLSIKGCAQAKMTQSHKNIVTIAIEHKAVLDPLKRLRKEGVNTRFAKLDSYGVVDLDDLASKIDKNTILISIQAANSEIGTLQPIRDIGIIAREHGVPFHTDAVQALGKIEIDVERDFIDLLSISAHKMYGPKGIGALYVRRGIKLVPLLEGGGHERGMRSGTLNVPGIVGLGKAAEIARRDRESFVAFLLSLRRKLADGISRIDDVILNGHPVRRLPNNLNYAFSYVEGESLILACRGVALSSGSACTSTSLQSSYVLKALNIPDFLAHCSIRFGLGKSNTEEQIDVVLDMLEKGVKKLRSMSPLYDMAKEGIDVEHVKWSNEHKRVR